MSYDYPDPARPPIRPPKPLVGTPRQVDWTTRIYGELADRVGQDALPDILEARFWIDVRESGTAAQIAEAARAFMAEFESPFTDRFPRHTVDEARATMAGLCRLAASVGVVVADLETTGLDKTDRIVEVASVRWPSRQVVADVVVRPPEGMEPAEVSDITPLERAAAVPFETIAEGVSGWAGAHHLVTWNTRFAVPVLRRELVHAGLAAPKLRATCAMRIAAAWLEVDGFPSLEEALERMEIEHVGIAHRAMGDVLSTCAVLDAMASGGAPGLT